ncbi:cytochrome P450 [Pseudokordiimonas caeni]|uniref:cytochrome P450 n=1 Tax=Pseudokordiimonas caeni TaxID=2997908 RepID=UPI002811DC88|nr:cytochrome P450 [Pseudokordiimonas caeni]
MTARQARLEDIPGDRGLPILGHTLELLRDSEAYGKRMRQQYGSVYRSNAFFHDQVNMLSPEANEFVLMDKGRNFSSEGGWNNYLVRLFPRGLMLMDFDEHKAHRHIMAAAFKTGPMQGYMDRLNDEIPKRIARWGEMKHFAFYPAIKQLTLDMASAVFLGIDPDSEDNKKIFHAMTDMVLAAVAVVRVPIPGTQMAKGVKGRKFIVDYLRGLIPERRGREGTDMFTQLVNAKDENGNAFTDQEVIDHMIFMWLAAHDTITSSVTTLVYELGRHTDWQDKLREEIAALGLNEGRLPYDRMGELTLTEYAFKEALRMNPPVPAMPRKTVRDVEFAGYTIPKGTTVGISAVYTHRSEELWPEPGKFDPLRFTPENSKGRHKYAWIPFGGGAHMCLGLHFAYMQAKVLMAHLLPYWRIALPEGYSTKFQILPLIRPVDGLPITLEPLD